MKPQSVTQNPEDQSSGKTAKNQRCRRKLWKGICGSSFEENQNAHPKSAIHNIRNLISDQRIGESSHEINDAKEVLWKESCGMRTAKTQICVKRQLRKESGLWKNTITKGVEFWKRRCGNSELQGD